MAREKQPGDAMRVLVSPKGKAQLIKAANKEAMPFGIYVRNAALKLRGELQDRSEAA
jgi:hypothetical protein